MPFIPDDVELKAAPTKSQEKGLAVPPQQLDPEMAGGITETEKSIREGAAATVRYGGAIGAMFVPGLRGTALRHIVMQSLAAGGSEIMARKLERISSDPEVETLWDDYKAGLATTGIDLGVNAVTRGAGRIYKNAFGRLVIPSEIPADAQIALKVLGRMKPDKTLDESFKAWKKFAKNRPFAPMFGQINSEEKRFINTVESIARSGWFSRGRMTKFDKRNFDQVRDVFDHYINQRTKEMTDAEFGIFMRRLVGTPADGVKDLGEMFIPAEAYGKYLYVKFDDLLRQSEQMIDGTSLRQKVLKVQDKDVRRLFNSLAGDGIVPPLKATKASGLSEGDLAAAWQNLPAADVDSLIRGINAAWGKTRDDSYKRFLGQVKDTIQKPFDDFVKSVPELRDLYDAARMTYGQNQDFLRNNVIMKFRNTLQHRPSGVTYYFNGLKGSPADDYDRLRHLRDALYYQAALPRLSKEQAAKLPKAHQEALSALRPEVAVGGRAAVDLAYEKDILRPLRHKFIDNFIDETTLHLDHRALLKRIETIEKDVPELLHEIWGSPGAVKNIKEMLTTMNVLAQKQESNIFIQLAQAGAAGTVLGGAAGYLTSDQPVLGAGLGGAAGVLIGPSILARMFTKPELVREFTLGIKEGTKSVKMAQVLRKIAGMKIASEQFRDIESEDAAQFYSTFVPQGD